VAAVLWIIAILVLLGFVDLVLKVSVTGGKPQLELSVLFFKYRLLNGEKKPKEKKEKTKKEKKSSFETEEETAKKDPFFGSVAEAVELVRGILSPVGKFITGIRISKLKLLMSVGGSDAAATAIRYGQLQAAVHLSLTELRKHFRVRAKEISLAPNFFAEKTTIQLSFEVRVSFGSIVIAAARAAKVFVRHLIKYKGKKRKKDRKASPKKQEES